MYHHTLRFVHNKPVIFINALIFPLVLPLNIAHQMGNCAKQACANTQSMQNHGVTLCRLMIQFCKKGHRPNACNYKPNNWQQQGWLFLFHKLPPNQLEWILYSQYILTK